MQKILVIDDDRTVCKSLELLLKKSGYDCQSVPLPNEALVKVQEWKPDLILLDMNFSIDTTGKQGLAMLKRIKESYPELLVILITGWATLQLAVKGMKLGAKDFWLNHGITNISLILSKQPFLYTEQQK